MQDYALDVFAPVPEDIYRDLYPNYTDREIEEELEAWDKD